MQPGWNSSMGVPRGNSSSELGQVFASRCDTLLRRMTEVERALTTQEWWLLGSSIGEARVLAEVASLLAVARGELEQFLHAFFGRALAATESADHLDGHPDASELAQNPDWMRARQAEAFMLLQMSANALPAMSQYAETLRANAQQEEMPAAVIDPLGIVADRLAEAVEALHPQPPVDSFGPTAR